MGLPHLSTDQVAQISAFVADYIRQQQEDYRGVSHPVTAAQRAAMRGFFTEALLDRVRVLTLPAGRSILNPTFYPELHALGLQDLPDFAQMAAVTFENVVVSHEAFTDGLLFHELVHVEQYAQLGVDPFARLYVQGFLSGGGYEGIPIEIQAYTLDSRFHRAPGKTFSVADEVRAAIAAARL
jgi:hypothetical protein